MAVYPMPTHKRVQHPRERTAIVQNYIGPPGEIIVDVDRWEIRLHDGVKRGGHRFLSSTALSTIFVGVDSEAGKMNFTGGQFGVVTRVTDNLYKIRSLVANDGMTLENPRGVDGNFTLGLPDRLKPTSGNYAASDEIADVDLITETGFYALNANAVHVPTDLVNVSSSTLIVVRRSTTEVTQLIISIANTGNAWIRALVSGSWQNWVVLKPAEGTDKILADGTDNVQRTWTANQIAEFITDRLKDISDEDESGVVKSYGGSQKKFKDSWKGQNIGDKTFGPFGSVVNGERWIVYFTALARVERRGGITGSDKLYGGGLNVQLELDGNWKEVLQVDPYNGTPYTDSDADNYTLRFQYDGTTSAEKIKVLNSDLVTVKTIEGVWSGRMKFGTSPYTVNLSAAGYRFKLKT